MPEALGEVLPEALPEALGEALPEALGEALPEALGEVWCGVARRGVVWCGLVSAMPRAPQRNLTLRWEVRRFIL